MSNAKPTTNAVVSERAREACAHEKRVWVRLTYACNNHCVFCLDGDNLLHLHRSMDDLRAEVTARAEPGARLILSGGEASIHPGFLRLIDHGRQAGYAWIQTISNGRMFANPKFTRAAILAGLREVTISMHGHTPELHDKLVGVPGAFKQALAGLRELLASGRVVVSVDIVLNGANIEVIDEILAFYQAEGVREFDLLRVVPFGRAWRKPQREWLFSFGPRAQEAFARALTEAQAAGVVVWTNRLPAADLEGFESLIQDPHKLVDEVQGRRPEFTELITKGAKMVCVGERCAHCHMRHFCELLAATRKALAQRRLDAARLTLNEQGEVKSALTEAKLLATLAKWPLSRLRIEAPHYAALAAFLTRAALLRPGLALSLKLNSLAGLPAAATLRKALPTLRELVLEDPQDLNAALALPYALSLPLTRAWQATLLSGQETLTARGSFRFHVPSAAALSEWRERIGDPRPILAAYQTPNVVVEGLPPCLHPGGRLASPAFDTSLLTSTGDLDLDAFTARFIAEEVFGKAHACTRCPANESCQGAPLDLLRALGLGILKPLP